MTFWDNTPPTKSEEDPSTVLILDEDDVRGSDATPPTSSPVLARFAALCVDTAVLLLLLALPLMGLLIANAAHPLTSPTTKDALCSYTSHGVTLYRLCVATKHELPTSFFFDVCASVVLLVVVCWLLFRAKRQSSHQASWGQQATGLILTYHEEPAAVGFTRTLARALVALALALTGVGLFLDYALLLSGDHQRTLHDIVTRTTLRRKFSSSRQRR